MRPEIERLVRLGPFPQESGTSLEFLREVENLTASIEKPLTDEEAKALISLFEPPDSCYGLAWSVLHLIETVPGWPILLVSKTRKTIGLICSETELFVEDYCESLAQYFQCCNA